MWSRLVGCSAALVLSGLAGLWVARSNAGERAAPAPPAETQQSPRPNPERARASGSDAVATAPAKAAPANTSVKAPGPVSPPVTPVSTSAAAGTRAPAKLALGNDRVGRHLEQILAATDGNAPDHEEAHHAFVKRLERDQNHGLELLTEALRRIPLKGFPEERAMFLVDALKLDQHYPEVRKLALGELTTNPPPARPLPENARNEAELDEALSTTFDMALAAAAFDVFLRSTPDTGEALRGLLDAIAAQKDRRLIEHLTHMFLKRYPDSKPELERALAERGLTVNLVVDPEMT